MPRHVPIEIQHDEVYPRDAEHRFRIYTRAGGELNVLACTPTPAGIGETIVQQHLDLAEVDKTLGQLGQLGIYDAIERVWIVTPWPRGAHI